jgi:hypothetical protein
MSQLASTEARAKAASSGTAAAFRCMAWVNMQVSAWYLGIMLLVCIGLTVLLNAIGSGAVPDGTVFLPYGSMMLISSGIFVFVMGICTPLYLGFLMPFGITRGQFVRANMAAGAAIATLLLLVATLVMLLFDTQVLGGVGWQTEERSVVVSPEVQLTALSVLSSWVNYIVSFLIGWLIMLGFQLKKVVTAAGGILVTLLLIGLTDGPVSYLSNISVLGAMGLDSFALNLLTDAIVAVLVAIVIVSATRRVAIKC